MSTLASTKRFFRLAEAADYSGLSQQTLRRMIERAEIKGHRPTGSRPILVDRLELDRVITGKK
jgi:excisionase family DNA binding protein